MKIKHYILISFGVILIVLTALMYKCVPEGGYDRVKLDKDIKEPPFGHVLFDSILVNSLDKGYEVSDTSLTTLLTNGENLNKTLLCVEPYIELNPEDVQNFLDQGGNLLLATNMCNRGFMNKFHFSTDSVFSFLSIIHATENILPNEGDSIIAIYKSDSFYNRQTYKMSGILANSNIKPLDNKFWGVKLKCRPDSVDENDLKSSTAITAIASHSNKKHGGGIIVICSMPLLFTNYGIMENNNCHLVFRLLSCCGNRPVIRTTNPLLETIDTTDVWMSNNEVHKYGDSDDWRVIRESMKRRLERRGGQSFEEEKEEEEEESQSVESERDPSIIEYILSDLSLSTALYLSLLGILLFIIFTSRRKQRHIPIIEHHSNGQLEFIKQIGSLHYRRDTTDKMIDKKFVAFAQNIRETLDIDITTLDQDTQTDAFERISSYTTLPKKEISKLINEVTTFMSYLRNLQTTIINELTQTYGKVPKEKYERLMTERCKKPDISQMMKWIDGMKRIEDRL